MLALPEPRVKVEVMADQIIRGMEADGLVIAGGDDAFWVQGLLAVKAGGKVSDSVLCVAAARIVRFLPVVGKGRQWAALVAVRETEADGVVGLSVGGVRGLLQGLVGLWELDQVRRVVDVGEFRSEARRVGVGLTAADPDGLGLSLRNIRAFRAGYHAMLQVRL